MIECRQVHRVEFAGCLCPRHTIGHHVHTNIAGCDPDLYHFELGADAGVPGFRTSLQARTLPEKTTFGSSRDRWWRLGVCLRAPFTTFGPSIVSAAKPDLELPRSSFSPSLRGPCLFSCGT